MRYFLVLAAVNLMWAFQFSGAKIATEQLGPVTVAFLPLSLATLLLAPWLPIAARRRKSAWPGMRTIAVQATILGLGGSLVAQLGVVWGVQKSLASNAAVLNLTIPVVTAVFAAVLLGEKMTRLRWISFALALGGVVLVSDVDWRPVDLLRGRYLAGNLLIFASCCGSAFYNTYSKRLLAWLDPVEVLVYSFIATDAVLLGLALAFERDSLWRAFTLGWSVWLSLLLIAVFSLALSMVLYLWVIDHIDVMQASLSIYLLPVFGVLLSSITIGESITWELIAGGALVVVSTFLVTIYEERQKRSHVSVGQAVWPVPPGIVKRHE